MIGLVFLKESDLLAYILKSGQNLDHINIILFRHRLCHICGNDGLHQSRMCRHHIHLIELTEYVLRNDHAGHVAGKRNILAGIFALAVDSEPVGIRISSKHDIGIHLFRKLDSKLPCLRILGIRIGKGRKLTVGSLLFANHMHLCKSQFL